MADWSFYDRGFSVFPLTPRTKTPGIASWEPYQTQRPDARQITAWAAHNWNMAVATGVVSGCIVLDTDSLLAYVEAQSRGLPETLTIATPRGKHVYFQHPGWQIKNKVGRTWTVLDRALIGSDGIDGWDIRADGGYVVGPGSYYVPTLAELAEGKVEGAYAIEIDAPMAPAPKWLLELLAPREHKPSVPAKIADETSDWGRAALNGNIADILKCVPGEGSANNQINTAAFRIGQAVGGGQITSEEAWDALVEALAVLGIGDEDKALGTIERGFSTGLLEPRGPDGPMRSPIPSPLEALGARGSIVAGDRPAPPPPTDHPFRPEWKPRFILASDIAAYFEGCTYVANRDQMFLPSGVMVGRSAFDALFGGPNFSVISEGKPSRSAWEMFRQNDHTIMPMVWDICFRPELAPGQIVPIEGLPFLNIYVPVDTPRRKGDPTPFLEHVRKMLPQGNDADYLLHWMASAVQNPGVKFFWWPVVQGTKGNGKSLLLRVMTHALGERYTQLVRADAVIKTGNQFNDWIVGKLFLGFEEIRSSEGRRDFVEMMKDTVTDSRISTEGKGRGQSTSDNRANGMMLTNWKDACPVDDDERRWGIFYTAQQSAEDLDRDGMSGSTYFPTLYRWLRDGGYEIVTNYLTTMPLQAELDPAQGLHRAPFTSSTREAINESHGIVEQEIVDAVECDLPGFRGGVVTSLALRALFDRLRKTIAPKRYRGIMASLGFVTHPCLEANRGRPNNPLYDGTRPVIYYKRGSDALRMAVYADVILTTEAILRNEQIDGSNVVPFRRQ